VTYFFARGAPHEENVMRLPASVALFVSALSLSIACGGAPPSTESPTAESTANAAAEAAAPGEAASAPNEAASNDAGPSGPAPEASPSQPAPAPAGPPPRERVRIHNSYQKQMKLRIERNNDSDLNTSINQNTSMEERAKDGDEIRLLSENNSVLHTIKIEDWMKEVDVVRDCSKLEGKR
jgi:hypothetical protein